MIWVLTAKYKFYKKKCMKNLLVLFLFLSCNSVIAQPNIAWKSVAPGVWSAKVGKPDPFNFYTAIQTKPRIGALQLMEAVNFPLPKNDIKATIIDGKTYLHFPLDSSEKIFGLGLNFKTVEQRGRIMRLHMDHYGGQDNGRNHAPVPFYISSKGYGVLINAARYIDVWVGTAVERIVSILQLLEIEIRIGNGVLVPIQIILKY